MLTACEIVEATVEGFCVIYLRPSDWKAALSAPERSRYPSAYRIAVEYLLIGFSRLFGSLTIGEEPQVSIFLEDGHSNANDAIVGVRGWKLGSEPPELPEVMVAQGAIVPVRPRKAPEIRIDQYGLVSKRQALQVQCADLLAYLVGAQIRSDVSEIYEGILDRLSRLKGIRCQIGPDDFSVLAQDYRSFERNIDVSKQQRWMVKKALRAQGAAVYELATGGMIVDTKPPKDRRDDPFHVQALKIQQKYKEKFKGYR